MIRLFGGFDMREAEGFHVFSHSVIARATQPVQLTALSSMGMPSGSNAFTLSRFLVPYLCGFRGHALFCDASDMLMLADVAELDALFDPSKAVQVVQHQDYVSDHLRKYVGTEMECEQSNYPRKNWASVMLMNCEHPHWRGVDPDLLAGRKPLTMLKFGLLEADAIGALPAEWNVLVDEGQASDAAKLLHWTAGIPSFKHYQNARRSRDWFAERDRMLGAGHG